MNDNTKQFIIGFASSFVAGIVLIYLYSKWHQQEIVPMLKKQQLNDLYSSHETI